MRLIFETGVKSRHLYRHWLSTKDPDDLLAYIQSMVKAGEKVEVVDQARLYLNQTNDLNLVIFDVLMQSPEEAERILRDHVELRVVHLWDPDLYSAQNFVDAVKAVYGGAHGLNAFRRQHRFNWSEKTILGQVALTEIAEDPKAAVAHVKGSIYRGIPAFTWKRSTPWGKRALKNLPKDKESMKWYAEKVLGKVLLRDISTKLDKI